MHASETAFTMQAGRWGSPGQPQALGGRLNGQVLPVIVFAALDQLEEADGICPARILAARRFY